MTQATTQPERSKPYKPENVMHADGVAFASPHPDIDGSPPPNSFGLLLQIDGEWRAFTVPIPIDPMHRAAIDALMGRPT
jgi:hypothetical protein